MSPQRKRQGTMTQAFLTATAAMLRSCPICQASPNQMCRRWISGKMTHNGKLVNADGEGGYWKRLANIHPERAGRKPKRPRAEAGRYPPTATPTTEGKLPDA